MDLTHENISQCDNFHTLKIFQSVMNFILGKYFRVWWILHFENISKSERKSKLSVICLKYRTKVNFAHETEHAIMNCCALKNILSLVRLHDYQPENYIYVIHVVLYTLKFFQSQNESQIHALKLSMMRWKMSEFQNERQNWSKIEHDVLKNVWNSEWKTKLV